MDLSAALRQAECEEDRPQGFGRLPAVPTGGTLLKREGVPTVKRETARPHRRRGLAWPSWPADGLAALVVTQCTVHQSL
jgi:hypothetical protein